MKRPFSKKLVAVSVSALCVMSIMAVDPVLAQQAATPNPAVLPEVSGAAKPASSTPQTPPVVGQTPAPAAPPLKVEMTPSEKVVQQISSLEHEMIGGIDWENGVVYGVGDGVAPTDAVSPAQARVRAKRAAIDEAMARLLETVQEVRVDAESTTRNMINENRLVSTRVSGLIQHAEMEELRQAEDGSFQIKMKMPLNGAKGLSATLIPGQLGRIQDSAGQQTVKVGTAVVAKRGEPEPAGAPAAKPASTVAKPAAEAASAGAQPATAGAPYTSLILDARGSGAGPAVFPRILTRSGEVVYDLSRADANAAVMNGLCAYHKSIDKAKGLPRAGTNPLLVTVADVSGTGRTDLVLDDADGQKVTTANAASKFLDQAAVIVVID
jgi:hypothetical protein